MSLSQSVFIDRANRETAVKAFDSAAEEMRVHRQSVFIFPEGTRSYSDKPELLPFKKGAFHLAVKAGVPVVPVVVENYSHILSPKNYRFEAGSIKIRGMCIGLVGLPSPLTEIQSCRQSAQKVSLLPTLTTSPSQHKRAC
jgi:lysophosphatidate acyltransferase